VAVAQVGTYLPQVELKLKKSKLRGVVSEGMICSLAELGLEKSSEGIHEFAEAYPLGSDVRPLLGLNDTILDLTSTANRADALSMVGIAREVAAITRNPLHLPSVAAVAAPGIESFDLKVADQKACPAYSGTLIQGVQIGPSPNWLRHRLEAAGTRSINNVVDITNLVLLEWGQPLHAFDWQRLQSLMAAHSQQVGVRMARSGEHLRTLDGQNRALQADNLLITAADRPVALAGVMGGEDTEVFLDTEVIFLEAALFDPVVVRRSARRQGLRTEASARYERGVDFSSLFTARDRAIHLILELAGGEVVGQTVVDHRPSLERQIELRLSRMMDLLGSDVRSGDVEEILPALGFHMSACELRPTTPAKPGAEPSESATTARCVWQVQVPPYRIRDIEREIDLIEEFARLYGYDQFTETLPPETEIGSLSPSEKGLRLIRETFRSVGLTELIHISLCSAAEDPEAVAITNPMSPEFSALRRQLLPGLLDAFQYNWDQGNGPLFGFEIGKIFWLEAGIYREAEHLGAILGGNPTLHDWQHRSQALDWFAAKGLLTAALQRLAIPVELRPDASLPQLHPGRTASLWLKEQFLGYFGQLHPQEQRQWDLQDPVFVFELDLELILKDLEHQGVVRHQPYSLYPASDRDIAFFAPLDVSVASLETKIRSAAGELLQEVELFDEYRGTGVPQDQRSLAFRLTYRAPDRTLTDPEVEAAQEQVRQQLVSQFQVVLRS
jgi:phenylalanyl-tRNA synthetase beta chain